MKINKRYLHHLLTILRRVRLWQLVILFLILAWLSIVLLRQNNLGMVMLRDSVKVADSQNGDVQGALTRLQNYVSGHMNTNMGDKGIYLDKTYQRAYDRAVQGALKGGSTSSASYQQADRDCQMLFGRTSSFPAYIQCVTDKVAATGPSKDPLAAIHAPAAELYRHNYISPFWSADLAGFAVLFTLITLMIIIFKVVFTWILSSLTS